MQAEVANSIVPKKMAGVTQLQTPEEEELTQGKFAAQLQKPDEEELMQGKFVTQLAKEDEEELMQGKFKSQPNKTGMPDNLKSGVEKMAGIDMGAVNVHFNSSRPAQLNAHAFTQGNDIHIAPGQQKHLPHEAWHVVQQSQGRVQPTTEVGGKPVNDNTGLEKEADVMGAKATQMKKKRDQ
ncbi:MAG: DUF4157 domain-containing protein [Planctomycetes bacterium]|nr:DUF4157 domain-containing protein [Planctomycetota bacterium]